MATPLKTMKKIIVDIAEPRRAGSEGEERVQGYLTGIMENLARGSLGWEFVRQRFSFPADTSRVLFGVPAGVLIFLLAFNNFALMNLEQTIFAYASPGIAVIILIGMVLGTRWNPVIEALIRRKDGVMVETANLILRKTGASDKTLVFTAHYDSKSGTTGFRSRLVLGVFLFVTCLIIVLYSIAASLWILGTDGLTAEQSLLLTRINLGFIILSFIDIVIMTVIYFQAPRNESPGVLDNASGVGVLFAQAEYFTQDPPANLNLWFLATSAEEEGLVGIVKFFDTYEKELDKKKTFFINLDGVSGEGQLQLIRAGCRKPSPAEEIRRAAKEEEVSLATPGVLPGIGFDSIPAAYRGYGAVSLAHVGYNDAAWAVHSKRDNLEGLSEKALEETYAVCHRVVENFSKGV